ncbi:MAG TPA: hydrogenase maturation nickel metallochaperone HypA [Syntrophomonas sp.]|nr:hydrogenase maturation nickel metallochaperone HypA [Syntrophomonas sp.]
MHELSIMNQVMDIVIEHAETAHAQKVCKINLEIGALSDIVPRWAQMFFDMVSQDTLAETAELVIDSKPAAIKCRSCGKETTMDINHLLYSCRECGSEKIELISGDQFRITSIEIR